ncbi:aKG-HExxH-type peptide beta-hydroxylase [Streptomyces malaysiensis]|uniref:aKG-HExxH-type peptide beta-hydroxylase n=1 Tax=Streptomyces malaysiensis TaxID=92644 RepID=UPI0011CD4C30|nr:HEXXH motif-containing putative peptide modification protein [Streptomyces malaysiensis]
MHFLNLGHLCETVARLAHAQTGEYPKAAPALGLAYRKTISGLRPLPAEGGGITLSYEDGPWARYCEAESIFEHIFSKATHSDGPTREHWDAKVRQAVQHIHELSPDLGRMVDLLVTDVVVVNSRSDGGGSTNTLPGLVVMSPGDWDVPEYAECLVHEGLHTGLFLMDMVYGMFTLPPSEMEKDEYRALSAVKIGQKRPLHAAFHAAAVAVPLMYMQHRRGVDTLVSQYTVSLRAACRDMRTHRDVFTQYGRLLLDEMSEWAEGEPLDFGHVTRCTSSSDYAGYAPAVAV